MNEVAKHFEAKTIASGVGRMPISSSVVSGILVFTDSLVLILGGLGLYLAQVNVNVDTLSSYLAAICTIWLTAILLFQFSGLYRFDAIQRPLANIDGIFIAIGTAFLFLLAAGFALKVTETFSRIWVGSFALAALVGVLGARVLFSMAVVQLARRGVFSRNIVIVGTAEHVTKLLQRLPSSQLFAVIGLFVDQSELENIEERPILGDWSGVPAFIRSSSVDDVVIALPWSDETRVVSLVDQLRELPVNVYLGADLIGLRLDLREPPDHFDGAPIFSVIGRPLSGWAVAIKACEDFVLGFVCLILAAIPMAVIAILIRLDGPGPVLFLQKRFGFNNQVFWIYKFRTMRVDDQPGDRTIQAKADDPRITRIGKFLRRTSLDELPQLFNVLSGQMSLVGPRPHALDHNEEYAKIIGGYFARHRVKPGITGWAQVNGLRGETDTPEKMEARVRFDLYYSENWSLLFDLRILAQTVFVLVSGRNAH